MKVLIKSLAITLGLVSLAALSNKSAIQYKPYVGNEEFKLDLSIMVKHSTKYVNDKNKSVELKAALSNELVTSCEKILGRLGETKEQTTKMEDLHPVIKSSCSKYIEAAEIINSGDMT